MEDCLPEMHGSFFVVVENTLWNMPRNHFCLLFQDVHREQDPSLRAYNLREFTKVIFERCPGLDQVIHMTDELHRQFNEYKSQVPAMGAILLNPSMQKCLLVRVSSFGHCCDRCAVVCLSASFREKEANACLTMILVDHLPEGPSRWFRYL